MGRKQYGKKEKLLLTSNFSFSHSVFKRLVLQTRKKIGLFGKGLTLNPLLHRYSFQHINNRQLLKTLWEKKKFLVTSSFFFSNYVFSPIRKLYLFLPNQKIVFPFVNIFEIISLFAAELEEPIIGILGKGLTLYQMTTL